MNQLFRILFLGILFTLLIITACIREEVIDFDYDDLEPKLTVQCYLCPQFDTIYVLVTQTVPWGEWFDYHEFNAKYGVIDAVIKLSGGNLDWVELTKDSSMFSVYSIPISEIPIIRGREYFIEVSAPGFETVTGSTTVPDTLAKWINLDTIGRFQTRFEDHVTINMRYKGEWEDVGTDFGYSIVTRHNPDVEKYYQLDYAPGDGFIWVSDIRQIGNRFIFFSDHSIGHNNTQLPDQQRSYFYLITGNSDYCDYQQAIAPYIYDGYHTGDVLGSSLLNTVVPKYYTNLSGGFGIFSAFRYTVDSINIIQ